MLEALSNWRRFPAQIEADLRFRGIQIADWHQGRMSSRELLVLIGNLPDESEYKRWRAGFRRGVRDWTPSEYRQARQVRETVLARFEAAPREDQPDIMSLYSPLELADHYEIAEAEQAANDDVYDQNESELYATHAPSERG